MKSELNISRVIKPYIDGPATFVECLKKLNVGFMMIMMIVDFGDSLINTTKRENYLLKYPRLTTHQHNNCYKICYNNNDHLFDLSSSFSSDVLQPDQYK